jgi:hypothetical protein
MKNTKALLLAGLAAAALAACKRQMKPAPNYDAVRQNSESSHQGLDQETAQPR